MQHKKMAMFISPNIFHDFHEKNLSMIFTLLEIFLQQYQQALVPKKEYTFSLLFDLQNGNILDTMAPVFNKEFAKVLFSDRKLCSISIKIQPYDNLKITKSAPLSPLNFRKTTKNIEYLNYYNSQLNKLFKLYNKVMKNYLKTINDPEDNSPPLLFPEYLRLPGLKNELFLLLYHK
jgi:hypothetical protein